MVDERADEGRTLTLALAKGRLYDPVVELLAGTGLMVSDLHEPGREMVLAAGPHRVLLARTADVPTFVAEGVADLGVTGKDVLLEQDPDVTEVLDLRLVPCRISVAGPAAEVAGPDGAPLDVHSYQRRLGRMVRVATKLPRVARGHFQARGVPAQVIRLRGNVELAPLVGLSDLIVDIVETGGTLKANDLVEMEEIAELTARLIANPVSYRLRDGRVQRFVAALREVVVGDAAVRP